MPRTQFEYELRNVVAEKIETLRDLLENNPYEHIHEVREVMGKLRQLREMSELMDEAQDRVDKRNS